MNIETRSIESIKSIENNPMISDPVADATAKSLEELGYRQPILVDEQGVILVGHARFALAFRQKETP